jgi:hypothetical protein
MTPTLHPIARDYTWPISSWQFEEGEEQNEEKWQKRKDSQCFVDSGPFRLLRVANSLLFFKIAAFTV